LDRIQSQDELTKLIISCFTEKNKEMNKKTFVNTTQNFASDLFLPLYCLLRNQMNIPKKIKYLTKMNPILIPQNSFIENGKVKKNIISTSKFLSKSKFLQVLVHQSPKVIYSHEVC